MISYLSGDIHYPKPNLITLKAGFVGYEVHIPLSTFYEIENIPTVGLFIHTHVREDTIQLFGFKTEYEKDLFLKLISVQGIGCKSAIGILSGMHPQDLVTSLRSGDVVQLTTIPGIGKKSAERLAMELKSKLDDFVDEGERQVEFNLDRGTQKYEDVIGALVNLGYKKTQVSPLVKSIMKDNADDDVSGLLRKILKSISNV